MSIAVRDERFILTAINLRKDTLPPYGGNGKTRMLLALSGDCA
jgi:hypothetical protein